MPDPNPYESPHTPGTRPGPTGRSKAVMALLVLLSLPAGAVAFFATCYAGALTADAAGAEMDGVIMAGLVAGGIGGLGAMGLVLYFALFRRPRE